MFFTRSLVIQWVFETGTSRFWSSTLFAIALLMDNDPFTQISKTSTLLIFQEDTDWQNMASLKFHGSIKNWSHKGKLQS